MVQVPRQHPRRAEVKPAFVENKVLQTKGDKYKCERETPNTLYLQSRQLPELDVEANAGHNTYMAWQEQIGIQDKIQQEELEPRSN